MSHTNVMKPKDYWSHFYLSMEIGESEEMYWFEYRSFNQAVRRDFGKARLKTKKISETHLRVWKVK